MHNSRIPFHHFFSGVLHRNARAYTYGKHTIAFLAHSCWLAFKFSTAQLLSISYLHSSTCFWYGGGGRHLKRTPQRVAIYLAGLVVTMHQAAQEHCPAVPPLPQNILGMTQLVESSGFEMDTLDAEDEALQSAPIQSLRPPQTTLTEGCLTGNGCCGHNLSKP